MPDAPSDGSGVDGVAGVMLGAVADGIATGIADAIANGIADTIADAVADTKVPTVNTPARITRVGARACAAVSAADPHASSPVLTLPFAGKHRTPNCSP